MRNKIFIILTCILLLFVFLNCVDIPEDAEKAQTQETKKILTEINNQIGMPNIVNFQEKKLAKMIFELRDREDLICYAYFLNAYTGKLIFFGKCLGFGLPYSVQYTNPMKKIYEYSDTNTIPQADPNGLYMPDGLDATFIIMIDDTGEPKPVYVEPKVIVSPFKLH